MGQRLALVQAQIRHFLDERKGEELSAISICAGDGRDLPGVLASEPESKVQAQARLIFGTPVKTPLIN